MYDMGEVNHPFGQRQQPPGLQARIWALRLGFRPLGWDLGLETGIWVSRVEFRPRESRLGFEGRDGGDEGGEGEGEGEKPPDL